MISNDLLGNHNSQFSTLNSQFGSGCLLDDLMEFVYSGQNCRMLLIGDKAQLPPVGEEESPALMADMLRGYGMTVYECDLNQVLRQSEASGILWNATRIREIFSSNLLPHSSFLRPVGSKRPSAERLLPRKIPVSDGERLTKLRHAEGNIEFAAEHVAFVRGDG